MTDIILKRVYDEEGLLVAEYLLSEVEPPEPPIPPPSGDPDTWTQFDPLWRVGASGGLYATPGEGYIQGWYKKKPAKLVTSTGAEVTVSEIEIFVELEMFNPNIPSGEGMEFELPDILTPANPKTGRGGGGDLWILGGANHFSISPKWTDRSERPMRILIILGNGQEWTRNVPKVVPPTTEKPGGSLYFWMKYLK